MSVAQGGDTSRPRAYVILGVQIGLEHLSDQSASRITDVLDRFAGYLTEGLGIRDLAQVTPEDVAAFVRARVATSQALPSAATMHLRRSVVRLLFREARRLGLLLNDPTLDLSLPARSPLKLRPLTDDEVANCRSAALWSLVETRRPAAWAMAESGTRTSELARVTAADIDLVAGRVWIAGTLKTNARWIRPTAWGLEQLELRVKTLPPGAPLVYRARGSRMSAQASACIAIADVLTRAGLSGEGDVRPLSATAWAGIQVLNATGRIEEVARALGMRSLDRTARLISWDWEKAISDV